MKFYRGIIAALAVLLFSSSVSAQEMSSEDVKRLALEAILENPEIIMDAIAILQQREETAASFAVAQVLNDRRSELEQDSNAPIAGNPDGDVTIVEFFDYNCPYCKRAAPEVKGLIAKDPNVRVLYRE
jgi:protein-disulfide isomerase